MVEILDVLSVAHLFHGFFDIFDLRAKCCPTRRTQLRTLSTDEITDNNVEVAKYALCAERTSFTDSVHDCNDAVRNN